MTYGEMMAIITPICFSVAFNAVPYLDGRKTQRRVVLGIIIAFIATEAAILSQLYIN